MRASGRGGCLPSLFAMHNPRLMAPVSAMLPRAVITSVLGGWFQASIISVVVVDRLAYPSTVSDGDRQTGRHVLSKETVSAAENGGSPKFPAPSQWER